MFVSQFEPLLSVGPTEGEVFRIEGTAAQERRVVVENLDSVNTLTYRFQNSNDASSWTDEASNATLAPGARTSVVLSGEVFYRLMGSGSLDIAVRIETEKDIVSNTFITR